MSQYKNLPKWITPIENGKPIYGLAKKFTNEQVLLYYLKTCGYDIIRFTVKPYIHDDDNEVELFCGKNVYKT